MKVELTMEHARKNSFWFDMKILLQTVWVLTPFGKLWPVREHELVREFREKYKI